MFLKKVLHPFLIFFLFLVLFLLVLNVIISVYPDKFIKYFLPDNYELTIDKTNAAFIPFNAEFSGIDFGSDLLSFKLDKLSFKVDLAAFFSSKPFVDLNLENAEITYTKNGGKSGSNAFSYKWAAVLNNLNFSKINVNYSQPDFITDVMIESLNYNGMSGKLEIALGESFIQRGNLTQNFVGFFNGYISDYEHIDIQRALINGKDFIVNVSEGAVTKGDQYAEFSASFDSDFLRMFADVNNGKVEINGTYENGKVSSLITLTDIKRDNIEANGDINVFGNFSSNLNFFSEDFVVNGVKVGFKGNIDPGNFNTYVEYLFPNKLTIFDDKTYHVKLTDGTVAVTDNFRTFKTFNHIESKERYSIKADILKEKDTFILRSFTINTNGTSLAGKGTYSNNTFQAFLEGRITENNDLHNVLDFKHDLKVNSVITIGKDSWLITGKYNNKIASEIYNVPTERVAGFFTLEDGAFSFYADASFKQGSAKISGVLGQKEKSFDINVSEAPFNVILKYFNVKSKFDEKVTGYANISLEDKIPSVYGSFYFNDMPNLPDHKIGYSFDGQLFAIEYINLGSYSFQDPGYIDFSEGKINMFIEAEKFRYAGFPEIQKLHLRLDGELKHPDIHASFITKPLDAIEAFKINLQGTYDNLTAEAVSPGITVNAEIMPFTKNVEGNISFNKFQINDFVVDGKSSFSSDNLNTYRIVSDDLQVTFRKYSFNADNVKIMYKNNELWNISAKIRNEYIGLLNIEKGRVTTEKISGDIIFDDYKLTIPYFDGVANGKVSFLYRYYGFPLLNGDLQLKGAFENTFADVRLKDIKAHVKLNDYSLNGTVSGKDIDTEIAGKFFMERYYDLHSMYANIVAQNLYIQKYGFRSSVDFEMNYNGILNYISGDIFVDRGIYQYNENTAFVAKNGQSGGKLPVDFNISVKTRNPVRLESKFVKGGLNLDLKITNIDELTVEGSIFSKDSVISVGGGQFVVTKSYVKFIENSPPFLYMEASGKDKFNYLRLNVSGFLPEYEIKVQSLDPSMASNYVRSGTSSGGQQLMGKVFGGLLFKDIVNFTEKLIGINEINVEVQNFSGKKGEFVSLGKRFSDRLQLRYMVGTTGETEMNGVVGEYSLFDWLKLFVYTMPGGGTGAGFSFLSGF